jgi:hypothetical protein
MKDLHSNIKPVSVIHAIVVSETGNSGDIDLAGFNSAEFIIDAGVDAGTGLSADHKLVFTLQHADDNGSGAAGTYGDIATGDVLGVTPASNVVLTIDSTDEDNTLYRFGYVGGKRFVKLTWTETGTVSMPMSIMVIKGDPLDAPTSAN